MNKFLLDALSCRFAPGNFQSAQVMASRIIGNMRC